MTKNEKIVYDTLRESGFTPQATAAVMGVVGGESGFSSLKERSYRNTSPSRIRAIFLDLRNKSDSFINQLKQSDYNFFNYVYGGKYGNAHNEGWKYVGRGFNGITFKANYLQLSNALNIDLVNNPELLENPEIAAKALAYYFRNEKKISNFEKAFKEAYRRNAGYGNSWEYYNNSSNPVHVQGIELKRKKGMQYLNPNKKKSWLERLLWYRWFWRV